MTYSARLLDDLDKVLLSVRPARVRRRTVDVATAAFQDLEWGDVDVVLLAARRMASLFSLMISAGLPLPKRGHVLSDRFLELQRPLDWWNGKRVLVLDDSVYFGNTLADRVERVRRLVGDTGVISADVILCTENGIPKNLASLLRSDPVTLDPESAIAVGKQILSALNQGLIPYFSDFPVTEIEEIEFDSFAEVLESESWSVYDVTSSISAGTGLKSYTLIPAADFEKKVIERFGDLGALVEISKLRVFTDEQGAAVRLRSVPILSLGALDLGSIRPVLERVDLAHAFDAHPARAVGLMMYSLSRTLLGCFKSELLGAGVQMALKLDEELAGLLLGQAAFSAMRKKGTSFDPTDLVGLQAYEEDASLRADYASEFAEGYFVAGDDVVNPVLSSLVAFDADEERQDSEVCLGVPALAAPGSPLSDRLPVSVALDVLNDLGVSVPLHHNDGTRIFRGYRPGENLALMFAKGLTPGRLGGRLASVDRTLRWEPPAEGNGLGTLQAAFDL